MEAQQLGIAGAAGQHDRREPGGMEYFVGVGVADSAEQSRVGECALERVILAAEAFYAAAAGLKR